MLSLMRFLHHFPSPQIATVLLLDSILEIVVDTVCDKDDEEEKSTRHLLTSSKVHKNSSKASSRMFHIISNWVDDWYKNTNVQSEAGHLKTTVDKVHDKWTQKFIRELVLKLYHTAEIAVVPMGSFIPPSYGERGDGKIMDATKRKQNAQSRQRFERMKELAVQRFFKRLEEALNLRLITQATKCASKRRRCFEVYRVPVRTIEPILPIPTIRNGSEVILENDPEEGSSLLGRIMITPFMREKLNFYKSRIEHEFQALHRGAGNDSHCRVYAYFKYLKNHQLLESLPDSKKNSPLENSINSFSNKTVRDKEDQLVFFFQINIGELNSNHRDHNAVELSKEYTAVLKTGSCHLALATSGKSPSSLQYTPFILAAIVSTFCSDKAWKDEAFFHHPLDSFSGPDPMSLLSLADATLQKSAVGRFAYVASENKPDPLLNLNVASTKTISSESEEIIARKGMKIDNLYKSMLKYQSTNISSISLGKASIAAGNKTGIIVQHSSLFSNYKSPKRKHEDGFGVLKDCPKLEKICWKWTGNTCAAVSCLNGANIGISQNTSEEARQKTKQVKVNNHVKFKCGLVLEGSDVFGGLQALINEGHTKNPLPDYVRDALRKRSNFVMVNNTDCIIKNEKDF